MYTGPAWEKWGPRSVDEGGIGGSETAAVFTAKSFAERGHHAFVFSDCAGMEGVHDGVRYCDYRRFPAFVARYEMDLFVSSRRPEAFTLPIRAGHTVALAHDMFFGHQKDLSAIADKVDVFFALSPWHRKFMAEYHGIPEHRIAVTRDGVDLSRFAEDLPRVKGRMIYSSSPDRGLDVLLKVLPRIRNEIPGAELHVLYGFSNWEKACAARGDRDEIAWMESIKAALKQPGVVYHGRVGQRELARQMLQAELWGHPTAFTETWCCTAAEVMGAGVPVVTTDLAALSTTVGEAGVLIPGDNRSQEYQDRFVAECVRMLTDRARWGEYSARGREKAKAYSWDTIADEWLGILKGDPVTA
jgi:glycosyltransferase involved in cell wall biosynthesis